MKKKEDLYCNMFTFFKRIFKSGWISFKRQAGLSVATIFIMVLTISLITSLFLFHEVSSFLISEVEKRVDISVYFKETSLEEEILQIKEELSMIPEVREVEYISRDEALEKFIERHKDNPVLMEALQEVGENPLPASLNIRAFEAAQYASVAGFLETAPFRNLIEKIDYYERESVIERIFSITSNISQIGLISSLILALIAILIIFNQVRLAIFNSREEIKVQRLVGASNWFIRGPFLVQGAISGLLAAAFCFLFFTLVTWSLGPRMELLFPGLNLFNFFISNLFLIVLAQLFIGVGLGMVSSFVAIRKYLNI